MTIVKRFAVAALLAASTLGSAASAAVIDLTTLLGGTYDVADEFISIGSFYTNTYFAPVAITAKFTDLFVQGDEYGVYINGLFAFNALAPVADGTFITDPEAAFLSGKYTDGLVNLAAGDTLSFTALTFPVGFSDGTLAVTALAATVPEPASWALLIAGFGLTGAAMRRRAALPVTA
jgi:hypothetical protein